jgi:hypothetical protein
LRTSLACRPSGHPREPRLAAAAAHAVPPARRPPLHGRALGSWRYRGAQSARMECGSSRFAQR